MSICHGIAFCSVLPNNSEYALGMRGAFVPICAKASDMGEAVTIIREELAENFLELEGFESFYNDLHFHEPASAVMANLIDKLESYPIQFDDVHYFPPDG